jgi:2-polyprenyl-6-methoxyphenol hydroxylase-like FAD-dependent oxidoreductase
MQATHPSGNTGVVLVGDAVHAFPPDIGQGINAGLADVEALDRALQGKDLISGDDQNEKPVNLAQALKTYEQVRVPEIKSLIRLARFGSPYQYRQPLYRDQVGRILWSMNVALRLLLNKASAGKIPPAAIMMAMDRSKTYRQIMRRCDITVAALWTLVALVGTTSLGYRCCGDWQFGAH